MDKDELSPDDVLAAYALGYFPMADNAEADEFFWYDPTQRGQLPIDTLHVPRRLRETLLKGDYEIRIDSAFADVVDHCAARTEERASTWINKGIRNLFVDLHRAGHAHSVECWQGDRMTGGIYGLALGGVFCGESMFSRRRDASKIALVHLCARLWKGGFSVLDTQFINEHLRQFGVYEVPRAVYRERLAAARHDPADFTLKSWSGLKQLSLIREYLNHLKTKE